MRYYLIVGEASGDLHASELMKAISRRDSQAEFRYYGGDLMAQSGGTLVRHYRTLAYMGFVPVLRHLPSIVSGFVKCYQDICQWQPDIVIPVDYSGFNLPMVWLLGSRTKLHTYYYISPKFWAWQRWRAKIVKRYTTAMFTILPFEADFYRSLGMDAHYVGNPTASEVASFCTSNNETHSEFCAAMQLDDRPIIALLAGSRRQEIHANLPAMIEASQHLANDYQIVIAAAPGIEPELYKPLIANADVRIVYGATYRLLRQSTLALVTSGTATLETALMDIPQVVCYHTAMKKITRWGFRHFMNIDYISLVNLIAGHKVVTELFADTFSVDNIRKEIELILPSTPGRTTMLNEYDALRKQLGTSNAADRAAEAMLHFYHSSKPK